MKFKESLPAQCPPTEAEEISAPKVVYRLVTSHPPVEQDFASWRALNPAKPCKPDECQALGLSVHTELEHSLAAAKLPSLKGKHPCRVRLDSGAGFIQQTSRWSHHTWWPLAEFDILSACEGPLP